MKFQRCRYDSDAATPMRRADELDIRLALDAHAPLHTETPEMVVILPRRQDAVFRR